MTHRTDIRLADGRELFYYDREAGHGPLGAATSATTSRRPRPRRRSAGTPCCATTPSSPGTGRRGRTSRRPTCARSTRPPTASAPRSPLSDYEVVVFENRFPSFSLHSADVLDAVDQPPFRSAPGAGRCEVVCFSSDHDAQFSQLPPAQVETVIDAWVDRTRELSQIDTIDYVFCFENRGEEIGVTLSHPHGQIYGYPFVPPRFYRTADAFNRHRERTGSCLQCELVAAEVADGSADRARVRQLGRLRPVRRALAVRGARRPAAPPARPARPRRRRTQGPRRGLRLGTARLRLAVRHPDPLHRRLAPGARCGSRARSGTSPPSCSRSAAARGR